jgi:hypothetical protein
VSRLLVEALNATLEERAVELDHVERHLRRRSIRAHARDSAERGTYAAAEGRGMG